MNNSSDESSLPKEPPTDNQTEREVETTTRMLYVSRVFEEDHSFVSSSDADTIEEQIIEESQENQEEEVDQYDEISPPSPTQPRISLSRRQSIQETSTRLVSDESVKRRVSIDVISNAKTRKSISNEIESRKSFASRHKSRPNPYESTSMPKSNETHKALSSRFSFSQKSTVYTTGRSSTERRGQDDLYEVEFNRTPENSMLLRPGRVYPTNYIRTTKYTLWSFLPINLFSQVS
jgi:hypothetical protein